MPFNSRSDLPRRVFLTGMFDMMNFGDLMFPLIARKKLALAGIEIVPVSPTGASPALPDAMASVALEEMLTGEAEASGVLIGGGYIIHGHKLHFLEEYRSDQLADYAGPGLWLGATLAAAIRDVPMAWNAPGVPHPFAHGQRTLVDAALQAADYVSLRDHGSLELLGAPAALPVQIVPDPVVGIAQLWKPHTLAAPFRSLVQRKGSDPKARYLALHFRNRSLGRSSPAEAAQWIDAFASARDLYPILVAVGQTHADDVLAREIGLNLRRPHIVLDDPLSLQEIAAAIGHSSLYVGASLHGYVAAAAYGVPGVLVAQPSYRKFEGFLAHTGRQKDLAQDWQSAFAAAAGRLRSRQETLIPPSVFAALDAHWSRIAEALGHPDRNRPRRHTFLRSWLRAGVAAGGPMWAHLPYARRPIAKGSA